MKCLERGGTILELGSGTGRVLLSLATHGVHVTGLEQSTKMLDACTAKMGEAIGDFSNITLIEGDMRCFELNEYFNTIIIPYRTLMHMVRPEQQLEYLQSVRKHLEPDGRLFFNVWVPDYGYIHFFRADGGESELNFIDTYVLPNSENHLNHYHKVVTYPHEQRLVEEHVLIELDSKENEIETHTLPMTRTWFSIHELKWLTQSAGLEIVNVWGGFNEKPLDAESEESIWELKIK